MVDVNAFCSCTDGLKILPSELIKKKSWSSCLCSHKNSDVSGSLVLGHWSVMSVKETVSALIFLPTEVDHFQSVFLHGEIENVDETLNIYVTGTCRKFCQLCLGMYSTLDCYKSISTGTQRNWIHLQRTDGTLTLKKFKINGVNSNGDNIGIVVIYYHRKTFMELGNSPFIQKISNGQISERDHFGILKRKLEWNKAKEESACVKSNKFLTILRCIFVFLSMLSTKALIITQHSSLGKHLNNYLMGFVWITSPDYSKKSRLTKQINFLFAIILDVLLGAISLNQLNQHFPLDSLPNLSSAEMVVQLLKDLINWLTGNPAGFKLNYIFSKLLATFFLFYIDMWCAFLAILRPAYKTIMTVFFFIGKAGLTFQLSIIEDVLTVLTFHIYCICLFAARLYNIQIHALLALWRLFLGRKKNPLRDRVDSCKYTPEQLFIGTLGFTILLFLLPTTLIYYVVFTFFRIILMSSKRVLFQTRHLVQSFQLFSIMLWLTASPKVSSGVKLIQYKSLTSSNCLVFHAKPVCTTLRETLAENKPEFLVKTEDFNFIQFLYSLMVGRVQHG